LWQSGELAYMAHKAQQAKEYIRSHRVQYVYRVLRRVIYIWTGYWSFNRAYLAEEPLDVPNIFLSTTVLVLGLAAYFVNERFRARMQRKDGYVGAVLAPSR
jgi:hypothetical protein